jgi:hypothetical protein
MNRSIHPRNWGLFKESKKLNTSKPQKDGGNGHLRRVQKKLAQRRLAHAATIKSLPSSSNPMAYRAPGSMRIDK